MTAKKYLLIPFMLLSCLTYAQTGTTYSVSISSGGSARSYTYYVPTVYTTHTNVAVPLIINVHGFTGTSAQQETAEDFRKIADTADFIILHPQALGSPLTSWDVWNTVSSGAADRDYIMQALDSIEAHYNIDTNRVYVTGFSQGGYMSYNLSTNYSHRIAAMASVSGAMSSAYYNSCYPVHPLPVMEIHGTNDALVTYTGGNNGMPVETTVGHWIQFNHCNTTPVVNAFLPDVADSATVDQSKVVHYLFTGGCKGVTVEFYKILNGGHEVPSAENPPAAQYGVGTQNQDFTAAKEIWRFFRQYRLDSLYNVATPEVTCVALSNPPPTPPTIPSPIYIATEINDVVPNGDEITIYPNPSNGIFTINVNDYQNATVKIINVIGEVVLEEKLKKSITTVHLDVVNGIYLYQINIGSQLLKSGKLIVK